MKITEIRIKLMDDSEDRLRAFCSVTFDNSFVVRDLKIIEGNTGPFVAMPSRKLTSHCPECRYKNHLRARYCNQCGKRQPQDQVAYDQQGRAKLYADVAHPINADCREAIQADVVAEFEAELERAKLPGYVSKYDESYETDLEPTPVTKESEVIERVDPAASDVPVPHKQDQETVETGNQSSASISNENDDQKKEDFGKGIFD